MISHSDKGRELKLESQCKLHRSRTTHLIECATRRETLIERLSGLAERRGGQLGINVSKVGMVQYVECFGSELQTEIVVNLKLSSDRRVQLGRIKSANKIAWCISNLA